MTGPTAGGPGARATRPSGRAGPAAEADYLKAGFNGTLEAGSRPALLLVDVCRAYLERSSPLYTRHAAAALRCCSRLLAAARRGSAPVVFTRVRYQGGGRDGGMFYRKVPALRVFDDGSPLGDFPSSLVPEHGDLVVTKQYASAFFGTSLASSLAADGVDTVVIGGYSTSGCVRATATDALQHGLVPLVVGDACADRDPGPHEANLFDLAAKYAEVVDTRAAEQVLLSPRSAAHLRDTLLGELPADG